MSIGTYLITHIYDGKERGSQLLFTDSFFSMAGIIFPMIAAAFIARNVQWYWVYATIGILYLGIFILTLIAKFPVLIKDSEKSSINDVNERWSAGIILLAIIALFYILGQLSFISWVPEYATKTLSMSISDVGELVSYFWGAYMVGMWFFSMIMKRFDMYYFVLVLSGLSTLLMFAFNMSESTEYLLLIISALGFFSSAIYTTVITLGSQQTKDASPKVVNFILLFGTIGTMLTFIVTSPIVEYYGAHAALLASNGFYAVVFLMCIPVGFVTKHRIYNHCGNKE